MLRTDVSGIIVLETSYCLALEIPTTFDDLLYSPLYLILVLCCDLL